MTVAATVQERRLTDDEILQLFRNAQKELVAIIERADPSRPFAIYRSIHLPEIDRIIRLLEKKVSRWSNREIAILMKSGAKETADVIRSFKEKEFRFSFRGLTEEAVRVLSDGSLQGFGNTMSALRRNATKALIDKKKLQQKIIEGVIQGSSVARTQNQLVDLFKKNGISVLKRRTVSAAVSHWSTTYANLLVCSQSMAAYTVGANRTMLETGRRFAKILTIRPDIDGMTSAIDSRSRPTSI